MNQMASISRSMFTNNFRLLCGLAVSLLLLVSNVAAQTSTSGGSTPSGLQPGAPAGSYSLSGFENVNLYNGNLNFNLPLLQIGGRGGARTGMAVSLDSIKWRVNRSEPTSGTEGTGCPPPTSGIPCHHEPYQAPSGGGYGGNELIVGTTLQEGLRVGYGPGALQGKYSGNKFGQGALYQALIRLNFTAPDGTEHELLDKVTHGRPYNYDEPLPTGHGWTYVSPDGTLTFTSDAQIFHVYGGGNGLTVPPTGYLWFADGTRYRIERGLVIWIRDRNGNELHFTYYGNNNSPYVDRKVETITDSLGRVITVNYATPAAPYDLIRFPKFGNLQQQDEIRVYRKTLSGALRQTQAGDETQTKTFGYLFYELSGDNGYVGTEFNPPDVISEIRLPDNRSYKLYYNVFNELARVELPTGGAIEYDYTARGSSAVEGRNSWEIVRRVTARRMYSQSPSTAFESKQTYTPTYTPMATNSNGQISFTSNWKTTIEVKQFVAGEAAPVSSKKHTYYWSPVASLYKPAVSYSGWKEGKEYLTEWFDASGTLLRKVENVWQQRGQCVDYVPCEDYVQSELDMSWWTPRSYETQDHGPSNNPKIVATMTTLLDGTQPLVSKQKFKYDKYNNLTDTYDYDYNPNTAAAHPLRHTKISYLTANNSIDYTTTNVPLEDIVHLRGLPTMQRVYAVNPANGVETLVAKSETVYDETTYQVTEGYGTVTGLWVTAPAARGNATTSRVWDNVNSSTSNIETHVQYDQCGNVRKNWDGRGAVSEVEYSATYHYALPTLNRTPIPATGSSGSNTAFVTTSIYDFNTGFINSTTDANNQTTTFSYRDEQNVPDPLNRLRKVTRPNGGSSSFDYGDTVGNLYVRTQTPLDGARTLEGYQYFDGLGRAWRTSQIEGATSILIDTQYDALGRVWKVSNPYRAGDSLKWTTNTYDATGRIITVASMAGTQVTSAYSGNAMTVTDQAGKRRKSITDGLGRLTQVIEDPTGTLNYQTGYTYDALSNLRTVTQDAQTRTFVYDALSRLTSAITPESGTITFTYDNNDNVLTKTDARATTATYTYDALNRVVTKSYSNGTAVATPSVSYIYDATGVANSKGNLTSVNNGVSAYNFNGYDSVGGVTQSQQVIDGQSYSMTYAYDLMGNITSQTYPTGRVVTQSFDSAGRLSNISGQSAGTSKTYANSFGYTPHGAMVRMRLGNGRWEHTSFNLRLQTEEIGLGTSSTDSSLLKLSYTYGVYIGGVYHPEKDNGDVESQTITVPGMANPLIQSYTYDELNRLKTATELGGTSPSWKQAFSYDRYGNRSIDTNNTTSTLIGPNPQLSTSNNRITPRSGEQYDYDPAGNLTKEKQGESLVYDAENRLAHYLGGAAYIGGADYYYDGDGRRVKKAKPSETTIFVYNISGQLVAEYTTSTPEQNGTSYLTADTLGTPRVITKADGTVKSRHDYLPFGEEIYAETGNRSTEQGYGASLIPADKTRQKFASKERDNETGLDYLGARYYASTQGRFTGADNPAFSKGTDPQTWNLYTYTANNPLNRVDPTGQDWFQIGTGYGARFEWHEGKEHKYKDENGKEQTATNVGTHLLVFEMTGTNSDDAVVGTLTLYEQNKIVAQNTNAFSGGDPSPLPTGEYPSIPLGVYRIQLDKRETVNDMSFVTNGKLKPNYGIQSIQLKSAQVAWGSKRARMNEWDESLSKEYRGNFLHGRQASGDITAGCVCDRGEKVLTALFEVNHKTTPIVKMVVTNGQPQQGDSRPGPYVIQP